MTALHVMSRFAGKGRRMMTAPFAFTRGERLLRIGSVASRHWATMHSELLDFGSWAELSST